MFVERHLYIFKVNSSIISNDGFIRLGINLSNKFMRYFSCTAILFEILPLECSWLHLWVFSINHNDKHAMIPNNRPIQFCLLSAFFVLQAIRWRITWESKRKLLLVALKYSALTNAALASLGLSGELSAPSVHFERH